MRWFRKQQNRQSRESKTNCALLKEPFFWVMTCLLLYLDLITQKKNGGDL